MPSELLKHPTVSLAGLQNLRLLWICQAVHYRRRGESDNLSWFKGKGSGLNGAIVALGDEAISTRVED